MGILHLKSHLSPFRIHSDPFHKSMSTGRMVSERSPYLLCLPLRPLLVAFCRHLLLCTTSLHSACFCAKSKNKTLLLCQPDTCVIHVVCPFVSDLWVCFSTLSLCSQLDFPYQLFVSNIFVCKSVCVRRECLRQNLKESALFVCAIEFSSALHP